MIYNIYIYNKSGTCIYYEEWNRKKPSPNLGEEQKLLFGMLFSLKSFVTKTSPKPYHIPTVMCLEWIVVCLCGVFGVDCSVCVVCLVVMGCVWLE